MVKLGYVLIYSADVARSIRFYEQAFGLTCRFASEDGQYAELDTGATALAVVARAFAESNLPKGTVAPLDRTHPAPAIEIALVSDDVPTAVRRAVTAGADLVAEPKQKPWGQTVGYVRDLDGVLIELCTPMG